MTPVDDDRHLRLVGSEETTPSPAPAPLLSQGCGITNGMLARLKNYWEYWYKDKADHLTPQAMIDHFWADVTEGLQSRTLYADNGYMYKGQPLDETRVKQLAIVQPVAQNAAVDLVLALYDSRYSGNEESNLVAISDKAKTLAHLLGLQPKPPEVPGVIVKLDAANRAGLAEKDSGVKR